MRALFCEQVSDSRIRPTGCLFVYYFLNGYLTACWVFNPTYPLCHFFMRSTMC